MIQLLLRDAAVIECDADTVVMLLLLCDDLTVIFAFVDLRCYWC